MALSRPDTDRVPDVHMAGVAYAEARLAPPFSVRVPLGEDWRLYLVRGGDVEFAADDAAATRCRLPAAGGICRFAFRGLAASLCQRRRARAAPA